MNKLWSFLNEEQYERLCECRSIKSDIYHIAKCFMINRNQEPKVAIESALEHLDSNNQFFDIPENEYWKMARRLENIKWGKNMKSKIRTLYTIAFILMFAFIWLLFNNIPLAIVVCAISFILAEIGKKMEVKNNVRW